MRGIITSRIDEAHVLDEGLLDGLEAVAGRDAPRSRPPPSIFSIMRRTSGLSSAIRIFGDGTSASGRRCRAREIVSGHRSFERAELGVPGRSPSRLPPYLNISVERPDRSSDRRLALRRTTAGPNRRRMASKRARIIIGRRRRAGRPGRHRRPAASPKDSRSKVAVQTAEGRAARPRLDRLRAPARSSPSAT